MEAMHASEFARQRARIERRAKGRPAFIRKAMAHLVREAGAQAIVIRGHTVGWQLPAGGTVCVKIRYRDEIAAQVELARIVRFGKGKVPVRQYACGHCGGFHLTSQVKGANDNWA